jgi:hypothetical protein
MQCGHAEHTLLISRLQQRVACYSRMQQDHYVNVRLTHSRTVEGLLFDTVLSRRMSPVASGSAPPLGKRITDWSPRMM